MTSSFGERIRLGVIWVYVGQVYLIVGHFLLGVVLARLLGPSEFGVFIAVTAFTSFFLIGVQLGLPQAIIQAEELLDSETNAAFWSICLMGLLFFSLSVSIAKPLADIYDSPEFANVMYLMCGVFVLAPFTSVGLALLRREMRFELVARNNMWAMTVSSVLSIFAAVLGAGVYSLVVGAIAGMMVNLILVYTRLTWRPTVPQLRGVRSLLNYSGWATVNNTLDFARNRVDNVLVGSLLGTSQLGLYNRAFSLARIPSDQFAESIGPLMLGSLSRIQTDIEWSRALFFKAICSVGIMAMPFFVVLLVLGPRAVEFLYGDAWAAAGEPLRVMVIGAVFLMLSVTLRSFINAQALVRSFAPVNVVLLIVTIVFVFVFAGWGLTAVAVGISLREMIAFFLMVWLLKRSRVGLRAGEIFYAVMPAILAGGAALIAGVSSLDWATTTFGSSNVGILFSVTLSIFAGYLLTLLVLLISWRSHKPLMSIREILVKGASRVVRQLRARWVSGGVVDC